MTNNPLPVTPADIDAAAKVIAPFAVRTPLLSSPALNARVGAKFGGHYDASLWIQNALNQVYYQSLGVANVTGAGAYGFSGLIGPPRTFGATLRVNF